MSDIVSEIVLPELPDVPRAVEGLGKYLGLTPESLGMTSTFDRMVDTEDMALLSIDDSLRVRQKLENVYAGSEVRLTYKRLLEAHERLLIRDELKLKLTEPDYGNVLEMLASISRGLTGHAMQTMLIIEELAREANLGPKGARLNISVDHSRYRLPEQDEAGGEEFVFEIESHGLPEDSVLKAADWVLREIGGREARQCKYARGLRLLGKL
jgi:hypothetical protein